MPKLFSLIFLVAALVALSGCDGCQTSTDEEGARTGLVCTDEEVEKV